MQRPSCKISGTESKHPARARTDNSRCCAKALSTSFHADSNRWISGAFLFPETNAASRAQTTLDGGLSTRPLWRVATSKNFVSGMAHAYASAVREAFPYALGRSTRASADKFFATKCRRSRYSPSYLSPKISSACRGRKRNRRAAFRATFVLNEFDA